MPLNEARGYVRSNLTKEQKQEALAAIYGGPMDVMQQQFSAEQLEQMRAILAQHDGAQRNGIKEFDLNNPPKQPYVYQEFPRCLYHHAKNITRNAHSHEEVEAALAAGWSKQPLPAEELDGTAQPLDTQDAAEAAALDAIARKKKKAA
jgi:hypothetical protein